LTKLEDRLTRRPLSDFKAAWEEARGEKPLPTRADISLRLFAKFVPNMTAFIRNGVMDYPHTQMGEDMRARLDLDGSQLNLFDILHPDVREQSELYWSNLFLQPCGGLQEYSVEYPNGALRRLVSLTLPLVRKEGGPVMAVSYSMIIAERFQANSCGKVMLGEHYAAACLLDAGFGVPDVDPGKLLYASDPMFA